MQLPVAHAQNILPDIVISGHVTYVTSGHVTSGHAQSSDPPHDPPQMRLCPYPYTSHPSGSILNRTNRVIDPVIKRGGLRSINRFKPAIFCCACPKSVPGFPTSFVMVLVCAKMRGDCSFLFILVELLTKVRIWISSVICGGLFSLC